MLRLGGIKDVQVISGDSVALFLKLKRYYVVKRCLEKESRFGPVGDVPSSDKRSKHHPTIDCNRSL